MITYSKDRVEKPAGNSQQYVKKVISYIQLNYTDPIKIESIAYACGLNRSDLTRIFKESTGYSLQEYLTIYRMKVAGKLLIETRLPVQSIASKVGYGDAFTFTKAFKRHTGKSPSEYRSCGGSAAEEQQKNPPFPAEISPGDGGVLFQAISISPRLFSAAHWHRSPSRRWR